MSLVKRVGKWLGGFLVVALVLVGVLVVYQAHSFDASLDRTYDVPTPAIARSTDPAVIARGRHIAESFAGCATKDCHGTDLGAGRVLPLGPLGNIACPNLSLVSQAYSDGELARLIRYGVKKDGRGLRFMPFEDTSWLPDSDVQAVVSFIRTVPVVDRPNQPMQLTTFAKVLDRLDLARIDVTRRRVDYDWSKIPAPAPTAEYGRYLAHACMGCHGDHLSGGPIPGAPPTLPVPLNLTPDETGLKGWTYDDFTTLLSKALRKNGKTLNPFMPVEALDKMDDVEKHALFAYLQSLPPLKLGGR